MYRDVEIKKLQVTVSRAIPPDYGSLKSGAKLYPFLPADLDAMVYQLVTFVNQTDKTIERRTERVPDSPLDHFREKYFPSFLNKAFPIRHREIEVLTKLNFLCPHIAFGRPDDPVTHVAFLAQGDNK